MKYGSEREMRPAGSSTRRYKGREGKRVDVSQEILNITIVLSIVAFSVVSVFAPLIHPDCPLVLSSKPTDWNNPSYTGPQPCRFRRHMSLLGLNLQECDFGSRIIVAAILGAVIGFERRTADRPAGIRTMSLASIGAAAFTVCSSYGFSDSPMIWDSSRISAAIPSGIGFLGAGIIWKGLVSKRTNDGEQLHEVRGLTTAASVWLSAAVGLAVGGGLYAVGVMTTMLTLVILRFGPRFAANQGESEDTDSEGASGNENSEGTAGEPGKKLDSKSASRILRYIKRAQNHASLNPYV